MFLKEGLQLDGASLKVLKQKMKTKAITSTSSSCHFPHSQLEWLCLEDVNDLESLPKEWALEPHFSSETLYLAMSQSDINSSWNSQSHVFKIFGNYSLFQSDVTSSNRFAISPLLQSLWFWTWFSFYPFWLEIVGVT